MQFKEGKKLNRQTLIVVILTFAVAIPMCLHVFSMTASSASEGEYVTVVSFSESQYTVAVNEPFNVTIMVENVSGLGGWQVQIFFDPNVLKYVTLTIPSDNVFGSRLILAHALDSGSLAVGACTSPCEDGRVPVYFSGTGKLVTVTFIMKRIGTTQIDFDHSDQETFLLTSNISTIQRSVVGSSIHSVAHMPHGNDTSVGIEKLVLNGYAENVAEGWNLHLTIENTGNVPASFDNSTLFVDGSSASAYAKYKPIENFSQLTIQPGATTELLIFLPAGAGSPWQKGKTLQNYILTVTGNLYSNLVVLP